MIAMTATAVAAAVIAAADGVLRVPGLAHPRALPRPSIPPPAALPPVGRNHLSNATYV